MTKKATGPSTWLRTGIRQQAVVRARRAVPLPAIVLAVMLFAAPAFAQRDTLKMGETLGAVIVKGKRDVGAGLKPALTPPEKNTTVKESLAIEHVIDAREKKETK